MPIDARQISELLNRFWPVLVTFAGRSCADPEDVVQSAFIKLSVEEPPPENCAAWLFTVVKRLASNSRMSASRRKERERIATAERQWSHSSQRTSSEFDLQELMIARLEARELEIVVARIWGELSFEQLAELVGEPKATVWRSYQAGIGKLKQVYMEIEHTRAGGKRTGHVPHPRNEIGG